MMKAIMAGIATGRDFGYNATESIRLIETGEVMSKKYYIPEYEERYRKLSKRLKRTKWICRAVSVLGIFWFFASIFGLFGDDIGRSALMLVFWTCLYPTYWTWGSVVRLANSKKLTKEIKLAYWRKCMCECADGTFESFAFDGYAGISEYVLENSHLLLSPLRKAGKLFNPDNNNFMYGVANGLCFQRADVNLDSSGFGVNWMLFELPCSLNTEVRFMSGKFLQANLLAGFDLSPCRVSTDGNGGVYHIGGDAPSEYLVQSLMRLETFLGDDCEILVQNNRLHILLQREGYVTNMVESVLQMSDAELGKQAYGRTDEVMQCVRAIGMAFDKGLDEKALRGGNSGAGNGYSMPLKTQM